MTTFPPPPGFDGDESGTFDGFNYYERACTPEEVAMLDAHNAAEDAADRAGQEAARDAFFAGLKRR